MLSLPQLMPTGIDIIILSYASDQQLGDFTIQCVDTLLASEDPKNIVFNIIVIESNKSLAPFQYTGTKTIYPDVKFGYNKYMNIGIQMTHNEYICLCNNDLVFHKGWASALLEAMKNNPEMMSGTPYCSVFHKNEGFDENGPPLEGYFGVLVGWCIFAKRKVFDIIGLLDEQLVFWYCDSDYCKCLEKYRLKNYLIPASKVTHLGSESLKRISGPEYQKLTRLPQFYYTYKWFHHSYLRYQFETLLFRFKIGARHLFKNLLNGGSK